MIKVIGNPLSQTHLGLIDISVQVYQWLSAVIPSANYDGALKARLEDTDKWFIDGERFARWKSQADEFLWISGTRTFSCDYLIVTGC
jgi:hypothetical protein